MTDIMKSLFDPDTVQEMYEKSLLRQGREEGREEGVITKGFDDVDRLVADGVYNLNQACEVLGVDIDEYREYKAGKSDA